MGCEPGDPLAAITEVPLALSCGEAWLLTRQSGERAPRGSPLGPEGDRALRASGPWMGLGVSRRFSALSHPHSVHRLEDTAEFGSKFR